MKVFDRGRPRSAQDSRLRGAALVWAAIWLGTAVVLQGGGNFADMVPILVVGTGWFLAAQPALDVRSRRGSSGY